MPEEEQNVVCEGVEKGDCNEQQCIHREPHKHSHLCDFTECPEKEGVDYAVVCRPSEN